jgi:hypothetical protein
MGRNWEYQVPVNCKMEAPMMKNTTTPIMVLAIACLLKQKPPKEARY